MLSAARFLRDRLLATLRMEFVAPGILLVACILAFSRWGTYVSIGPLYLVNLAFGLTFVIVVIVWIRDPARFEGGRVALPILLLVTWSVLRFVLQFTPTEVGLRDFAPYAFAAIGLLTGLALTSPAGQPSVGYRLGFLKFALVVHLAWTAVRTLLGDAFTGPELSSTAFVFQVRYDIDAALLAILVGACLFDALSRRRTVLNAFFGLAAASLIALLENRSGFLSLVTVVGVVLVVHSSTLRLRSRVRFLTVAAGAAVAIAAAFLLVTDSSRITSLLGIGASGDQAATSAGGTATARLDGWAGLANYAVADPMRALFGVGFGPNFLADAKVDLDFGSAVFGDVRSPHNYIVGTALRLGLVGAGIVIWLGVALVLRVATGLREFAAPGLRQYALLIVSALAIPSLVGVILEAPFGAIPFYWAAGVVLAVGGRTQKRRLNPAQTTPDELVRTTR